MKRIMVIGCCGAGKSNFSKALHERLKLPLIHLDQHYWKPNWTESEAGEWAQKVTKLARGEEWIIDGNFGGTMDIRIERADTIIYLDISTSKALFRILKRTFIYLGKIRPDMPANCPERISWEFIHYVALFNRTRRDKIFQKLYAQNQSKAVYILKTNKAIERFFNAVAG